MAKLPTVAIIGRPNTGKSTLFNRIVHRRLAIISDIPGTTRDHISSVVETDDVDFLIVDTGGMGGGTDDKDFEKDVHGQSLLAINHADLILFTVNAREPITKNDYEVIKLLRTKRKKHVPIVLIVTKCDNQEIIDEALPTYHELAIADDVVPVSSINNLGTTDVIDAIVKHLVELHFFKREKAIQNEDSLPRIALVGRPNVGKSSLVNAMMSDTQRQESPKLVSDIPGTTRDATDTIIRYHEQEYIFVDTAGLRKQARVEEDLESYAVLRTIQAMEGSEITVLLLDGKQEVGRQDKRIVGMTIDSGKGLIILVNKSDLMSKEEKANKVLEIKASLPFAKYAPVLFVSAKTREGLLKMFDIIAMVQRNRYRRVSDKDLHNWLKDSIYGHPMGAVATTKHITQAEDPPPTFVLFVKNPKQVQLSQLRYLDNRIREVFDFQGTPIRWITKGPRSREATKGRRK